MKILHNSLAIIALLFLMSTVNAGQVASTFATGDALTESKMNDIKNNINDNDGRISSLESDSLAGLECSAGQLAKYNGSIWVCSVDDNTTVIGTDSIGSSELKANSVNSASHISDEAGINSSSRGCLYPVFGCSTTVTSSALSVTSVTITPPGPGYIFVTFSGRYSISHTAAEDDYLSVEINTTATASVCTVSGILLSSSCNGSYRTFDVANVMPTMTVSGSVSTQTQFSVSSSDPVTYYLDARASKDTGVLIREYSMSAMYFPTSY
ncbi:MAG: hypothetical protein OEY36_06625 [Gammaproteobacteria bacterium]|nr:hypothetical protein [Gammaproteobacteria bacterium]